MADEVSSKRRVEVITLTSDTSDSEAPTAKPRNEYSNKQLKLEDSSQQGPSVEQDTKTESDVSSILVYHSGIPTENNQETSNENDLNEAEQYVSTYLDTLKERCTYFNNQSEMMELKMRQLIERIKQNNSKFLKDSFFKNLIKTFQNDLKRVTSAADLKSRNYELMIELARFTVQLQKSDRDEQKVKRRVKKLTLSMLKIQERIAEAEGKTLSLDDMEHHTEYTKLPRLYNTALLLWQQREKLLCRSLNTGRDVFKKLVSYRGTSNSELNKLVEEVFNNYLAALLQQEQIVLVSRKKSKIRKDQTKFQHFAFFTIIDLKSKLNEKITSQQMNFTLTDDTLTKIYRDLAREFKHRRLTNYNDMIRTYEFLHDLRPDVVANEEEDPNLKNILDQSEKGFHHQLQEVLTNFRQKDIEANGQLQVDQSQQIGWDDDDNKEEEESSDENEDESDDSDSD